ncbi:MAG: ABC transporter permease, partial [Sphingobacteriaceae bacterium]|nr:ABC transporter permease [Cytophagaceae bacterium]
MFRNYLKIALRTLWKHKSHTLINVLGLSLAFCCGLLLFLTAIHELSYDSFHANRDQIFKVYNQTGPDQTATPMPAPLTPALRREYPGEISHLARVVDGGGYLRAGSKELEKNVRFVDADFFRMFSFPFKKGSAETALEDLSGVVLTEHVAKELFGETEAMGQSISLREGDTWKPFVVSGVVADFPDNSSIRFDILARFEANPNYQASKDKWDNAYHILFLELAPNVTQAAFEQRLRPFVKKQFAGDLANLKRDGIAPDERGDRRSLRLLPLTQLHFNTDIGGESVPAVKAAYPYLLLIIAGFIVLIATINFVNLTTARSLSRSREVGMRKVLGALKGQLVAQFWGEAFLICLAALLLGGVLASALLPVYKKVFNSTTSWTYLQNPLVGLSVLLAFVAITLLAGGYPAWFMARFNTVTVLKNKASLGKTGVLRNTLLVVQFALATLLMACTLVAWQQMNFLRNKPLGFNETAVVSIPVGNGTNGRQVLKLLRDQLSQQPRILSVTGAYKNFGRGLDGSSFTSIMGFNHKNREVHTHWQIVEFDYAQTLDLKVLAGRDFSRLYATDSSTSVLINEAMAKELGEKTPVGTLLNVDDGQPNLRVIGVVKDFHHESLKQTIKPLTLHIDSNWPIFYILVKIAPDRMAETMELLEKTWKTVAPKAPFEGSFLDENTNRQYRAEEKLTQLFVSAAILAIVLSCMGLFAIALLTIEQRTKEIGVRKVLGASVASIVGLISRD